MTAEIISVGDELLIGQVVNTNASFIGALCAGLGLHVRKVTTIGDDHTELLSAFKAAWDTNTIVLVTGGLGPTHDDVTRSAVTEFFGTELEFSENIFADIQDFFAKRKRNIADMNRDQAMVPRSATAIRNPNGTAPGMHFAQNGKHFFVMPGVPEEMKAMMSGYVHSVLASLGNTARSACVLMTTGIPESQLAANLSGIEQYFSIISVAYLPSALGVRIRLTAKAETSAEAEKNLATVKQFVYEKAGDVIFAEDEVLLEEAVARILTERNATVSIAESCTGGLLSDMLTNVSGSSAYFDRGMVTYSNESKTALLNVPEEIIARHGAVSKEVAMAMAKGARLRGGTQYALSTTGIAGPTGGSEEKPVGLVWIGFSSEDQLFAFDYYFGNDRRKNKIRAAQAALDILRRVLLGLPVHHHSETEMHS